MNEQKKHVLNKINKLIDMGKIELSTKFPNIHMIQNGFFISFFDDSDELMFYKKSYTNDLSTQNHEVVR